MSYKQNKNPFKSSPLNHNLRDKRTGADYNHFHDPNNASRIYTSDQKVISGSSKFGTQSGRAKNLPYDKGGNMNFKVGQRVSEEDLARDYARQLASMYNSGQVTGGAFLADDLYKRNSKLSFKKGKLKLRPGYKGIDEVKNFGGIRGIANEDGSYTAPENQYTEDQIYDMMVQGGGLVSIVDGQIVAGNPNEIMGQGFDKKNRIRTDGDFYKQYEEGSQEDFERDNMSIEERIADYKARRNQSNSPVNNNSPLHQEQEVDQVSGEAFNLQEDYDYQNPVVTVTEGEWVNDPNDPGQQMRVVTTNESITGVRKNLNPGGLGQGQAENWTELKEDICSGRVKGDTSICDDVQSISNSVNEFRPITPPPPPPPPPEIIPDPPQGIDDLFVTGGANIKKRGFDLDLDLSGLDIRGMGGIVSRVGNVIRTKKGRCKGGCAVNPRKRR